jgi:hypothetical protein
MTASEHEFKRAPTVSLSAFTLGRTSQTHVHVPVLNLSSTKDFNTNSKTAAAVSTLIFHTYFNLPVFFWIVGQVREAKLPEAANLQ